VKVGFCGLGTLGTPLVERLLAAGHKVTVWNRSASKARALERTGALIAETPAELADKNRLVFLCLLDAAAVHQVVFGANGIANSRRGGILVDHSSISPLATREFASSAALEGWAWIDAPVSGGVAGARAGRLTVMAGGAVEALESVTPVMKAYAARITHLGHVGSGQLAKLCNQIIVAGTLVAIAEAVALAGDAGLDPKELTTALADGWADSRLFQTFLPRMTCKPSDQIGSLSTLLKDVDTIAALAAETHTPAFINAAVRDVLQRCI